MKVKVKLLSRVRLFVTPWIVAYQVSPSMGFSRQESWSGLPFPALEHSLVAHNLNAKHNFCNCERTKMLLDISDPSMTDYTFSLLLYLSLLNIYM